MRAPLPAELTDLLARLQAVGASPLGIGAEDVDAWPTGMAEALLAQGAIEPAAPASSIICPGCEQACAMTVHWRQRHDAEVVAFIACDKRDDIGRVPVPLRLLSRWQFSPRTLAHALARSLTQGDAVAVAQGWRLGWSEGTTGRAAVLLDGLRVAVAGHVLELAAVLTWDGRSLGLDCRALKRCADAPAGGVAEEAPEQRRQRLRKRKANLIEARVRNFLQVIADEEGISVTRVKQIIGTKELIQKAEPFDGLMRKRASAAPVSTARKPKA